MLRIRKIFILILTASLFGSCVSINQYNSNLNALRNEKQLKSDVDFIYEKLQKLHPRLNWYISKKDLDYKFDSLKSSINTAMTSNDFSNGVYRTFYSKTFKLLDSLKTTTLILDLRDNPGGEIRDTRDLYSYLADHDFIFIDKAEVVSRTSILHTNYFKSNSFLSNAILAILYPFELISKGITFLMVEKRADNKYFFRVPESTSIHSKNNHFKGDVYVIINGGTFSASCILSSNLKGSKRAVFVGEETGGAFNGTVAGKMTVFTLPGSKLLVAFGLAAIDPYYKTAIEGRGIFPDIEIKPTLADRISGIDPEINWILDEVKGRHSIIGKIR